ncbi:MAG: efflux RND transporter periplasmic adaptor subunit [Planctomycetes bacterium]|nr:efflux RND transporter periplasmic adaptor subunit [Planctomycetota bacterium]
MLRKGVSVRKIRILILLVVVLAVVGAGAGFMVKKRVAAARKPTIVRVEVCTPCELLEFVSAPAELEPRSKVEISAKVSGRVVALPHKVGDRVTRGDPNANPPIPPSVLVRLDSKDLESQLLGAQARRAAQAAGIESEKARIAGQKANLLGTTATLELAKTHVERQKTLLASQDISRYEFDQVQLRLDELQAQYNAAKLALEAAELNLKVLEHNLEAADAQIAQAKETLGYTTIVAPLDGVITRINAKVGEMVVTGMMNNPGTKILEVGDLSQMLAVAQVDEADVGKLRVGQKAKVFLDAYANHEFKGTVHLIALSADLSRQLTKHYKTEILLESDRRLHSGLTANVDIETRTYTDVLAVPSQAVMTREIDSLPLDIRDHSPQMDKSKTFATIVFRYHDGKAVITPVKIGPSNLTHTILDAGVKTGERIVVGPYKELEKLKHDQIIKDEREAKAEEEARMKARIISGGNDANTAQ